MERTDYDDEVTPVMLARPSWLVGRSTEEILASATLEIGRLRELLASGVATLESIKANAGNLKTGSQVALLDHVIQDLRDGLDLDAEAAQ